MIPVTKPFLPPLEQYRAHLEDVWAARWLTNQGPKVQALEAALTARCGAPTVYMANGTLALQLALRAVGEPGGLVLTTPFSFVATTSAPLWEGWRVRFVDVDPATLNLSPDRLAEVDAPRGTVVLATHVYGVACDVDRLGAIAAERGWVVIYDAAHAFGTTWSGRPLFAFGDLVATSFHATKLFHTGEGGAVFVAAPELRARVERLRSFGERTKGEFVEVGINAKSSELHASMGLALLPHMDAVLARRRHQSERYRSALGGHLGLQHVPPQCGYNHAYVPVLFRSEAALLRAVSRLGAAEVVPRRYFWPSLSTLPFAPKGVPTPVADDAAARVLCLPVYHELEDADIDRICGLLLDESGG